MLLIGISPGKKRLPDSGGRKEVGSLLSARPNKLVNRDFRDLLAEFNAQGVSPLYNPHSKALNSAKQFSPTRSFDLAQDGLILNAV